MITRRLADALDFAVRAHGDQVRKGTKIPYVSHLLGVAGLVFEGGGDEELAIAGLLHDVLEDTSASEEQLEETFGPRIARIVEACSDTQAKPKPPALERKKLYLGHLEQTDADTLLVSLADKLHNARTLLLDFRTGVPPSSRGSTSAARKRSGTTASLRTCTHGDDPGRWLTS